MGDASCQLQLGWHYEEGRGVERNLAQAVRWYRAAAEQNNPKAADNPGNMASSAAVWRRTARPRGVYARGALQNDHRSLYSLGRMYQYGSAS